MNECHLERAPRVTLSGPEPLVESLTWHNATTVKPDSDRTVLCWGGEGFFCGYWDTDQWIACESGGTVLGVMHWAEPAGPAA